jgi:hypothetical protein
MPDPDDAANEHVRLWMGEHYAEVKDAIATALTGAHVDGSWISEDRAKVLAVLVMGSNGIGRFFRAPWQDEIDSALYDFAKNIDPMLDPYEEAKARAKARHPHTRGTAPDA